MSVLSQLGELENELALSDVEMVEDFEQKSEQDEKDLDSMLEDDKDIQNCVMEDQEVQEKDPFLGANQEVETTYQKYEEAEGENLKLQRSPTPQQSFIAAKMSSESFHEYDTALLAKLFQRSNISQCKSNFVKRDRWKKIT